jgi:RNA-directed DNA polymerase
MLLSFNQGQHNNQPMDAWNFSKYARRAADEFGSKKIVRQVMKLERMVDMAIRKMLK